MEQTRLLKFQVAFIGISNWALDPAKMNRGILLSRGVPGREDLIKTAKGICARDMDTFRIMQANIEPLANGYLAVYTQQKREYYGLRDFYSLVKMVFAQVFDRQSAPSPMDITKAVQRNFGGYFGDFKPASVFLSIVFPDFDERHFLPPKALITEAIRQEGETRYILLLTKNNAALSIIQEQVHAFHFMLNCPGNHMKHVSHLCDTKNVLLEKTEIKCKEPSFITWVWEVDESLTFWGFFNCNSKQKILFH